MKFNLCGRPGKCCPEADVNEKDKVVTVTDDDGGKVKLTFEQIKSLYIKVSEHLGGIIFKKQTDSNIDKRTGQVKVVGKDGSLQLKPKRDKNKKAWIT